MVAADGSLTPPRFDPIGYLESIERCRRQFPELRIHSGLELGEPHWHAEAVDAVLRAGPFDRLLGSVHSLPEANGFAEPPGLFQHRPAPDVMREYLDEITRLVTCSETFAVIAHLDYVIRYWPAEQAGPFNPADYEEEFRHTLGVIADSVRTLEVNTCIPLPVVLLQWWHEEGGQAITFGSDAHDPSVIARGFAQAVQMADAHGFRPGRDPYDFWSRR